MSRGGSIPRGLSATLGGHLGVIEPASEAAKDKVGLVLSAAGEGLLAEFTCGVTHVAVKGSVIVEVKANKMLSKAALKYSEKKGVQRVTHFAGGAAQGLLMTIGDATAEQSGLALTAVKTDEQPIEVNSVY